VVVDAGVAQRLVERLVRVGQVGVLAAHGDRDLALRLLDLCTSWSQRAGRPACAELQLRADELVEPCSCSMRGTL
jgi:hypothetical protein